MRDRSAGGAAPPPCPYEHETTERKPCMQQGQPPQSRPSVVAQPSFVARAYSWSSHSAKSIANPRKTLHDKQFRNSSDFVKNSSSGLPAFRKVDMRSISHDVLL